MYSGEGTDWGTFGWDEESLPALVLTADAEDMSIRAIPTGTRRTTPSSPGA